MGIHRPRNWPLILVHMLLLQIQPVKMQGVDSVSQKLRRFTEQFQQFQALTQARLDMLALNQNRNSSGDLESRVQALSEHCHHMSQALERIKRSTKQEIDGLREWSRKLEKRSKRMEGRLALMERSVRENRRHSQKHKPDPGQDFSNLTLELQSHDERLAALQVQRDELLIGLKGLQESLKNQALRVTRLEGRLALEFNEGGKRRGLWRSGEPLNSDITPEDYYEPRKRSQAHRGGRPGRILGGQPRPEGNSYSQTQTAAHTRNPSEIYQHQAAPKQAKHSKTQKPSPRPESHPQIYPQYSHPRPLSTDSLSQSDPYPHQSQIQLQAQTRPYTLQEQLQAPPHLQAQMQAQVQHQSQLRLYHERHPSHPYGPQPPSQAPTYPEFTTERQSRVTLGALKPPSDSHQPRVTRWDGTEEVESDTKVASSLIHDLLQLPVRQKIPAKLVPKTDGTICNVDSVLFFPSASAGNYVTFSRTLPELAELSVCLWLRVEASHVGTLLSYATDDNDNQLVLYGRNSSASSASLSASPPSSNPSHSSPPPHSYSSSPTLDFVIGDPVYRRLPMSSLLDTHWHHLCVVWSSIQGRFWHYTDRRLTSSGSNFRKGWEIPGGGSVVLGQEQDAVGGGFDPAEGFAGQVAGFNMWKRVLSPSEVEGVADGRGVPRGVVLGMEDIEEVHGEVQQVACECLENCV